VVEAFDQLRVVELAQVRLFVRRASAGEPCRGVFEVGRACA
jgi:hypothetical protein